jgi:rhomboid domain-containing protein 1
MYRQRGGGNAGLLFLILQIAQIGLDKIPPVTLVVGAINVLVHYFDTKLSIYDVCIGASMVWNHLDLRRLVLASFFHLDDMHLYYNMVSLLWKGRDLEPRLGSKRFATLIVLFVLVSNTLMVLGSVFLARFADMPGPYRSCAVGFSAVLFALKVVSAYYSTSPYSHVMGFVVPTQYIYWFELALIHVLVPGSSFFGHLCGIITGLLYTKQYFNGVLDLVDNVLSAFLGGLPPPASGSGAGGRILRDGVIYGNRQYPPQPSRGSSSYPTTFRYGPYAADPSRAAGRGW